MCHRFILHAVALLLNPMVGVRPIGPIKAKSLTPHLRGGDHQLQSAKVREPTEFNANSYSIVHNSTIARHIGSTPQI